MQKKLPLNLKKRVWVVTIVPTAAYIVNVGIQFSYITYWNKIIVTMSIILAGIINLSTAFFYVNCYVFRVISLDVNQRIMVSIVPRHNSVLMVI